MKALLPTKTLTSSLLKTHVLIKSPLYRASFSPRLHILRANKTLRFTITCKLNTSKDAAEKAKNIAKKIALPDTAPSVAEKKDGSNESVEVPTKRGNSGGVLGLVKRFPRRVLAVLSNLPLAIGEMFTVAGLMALGMLVFCTFK